MLWPLFGSVLFIIYAWRDLYRLVEGDFLGYFLITVVFLFLIMIMFMIGLLLAGLIGTALQKQWGDPNTDELVSLRNSEGVTGRFFLGSGSIGLGEYYFFYKKAGDGYCPGRIEVTDNVTIYEQEREDGQLNTYTRDFTSDIWWLFAVCGPTKRYEFMIPTGSLKKNFVLQ